MKSHLPPRVLLVGAEDEENLSLRYLAAALQADGYRWEIVAFNSYLDSGLVLRKAKLFSPTIIGLSMVFQIRAKEFLHLSRQIREQHPLCHITAGGHFASLRAKELLRDNQTLDSIVRFDGEESLCELIKAISENRSLKDVPNLVFRDSDGSIIENKILDRFPDLDGLPWPVRPKRLDRHLGIKMAHMLGSRGCYHSSCRYCCIAALHSNKRGKKYALRSPRSIVEEMSFLKKRGTKIFFFHDDNFFLASEEENIKRFDEIKTEMAATQLNGVRLYIKSRPSTITEKTISGLKSLGVGGLFLGLENHANNNSLYLGRNETSTMREDAIALLKNAGFLINYNLLLFNPNSTPEDILCNLKFIEDNLDIPFNFGRVEIYAGTPLEKELTRAGRLFGSYLAWDYKIADYRIECMSRWCRNLFAKRRFQYRGLINQNITLGYHADVANYFFTGPLAEKMQCKVNRMCRAVNSDTLKYLRELFDLAMDNGMAEEKRKEILENIRIRIDDADSRLLYELLALRKQLDLYSTVCSCASRFRLANSQDIQGLFFSKLLGSC